MKKNILAAMLALMLAAGAVTTVCAQSDDDIELPLVSVTDSETDSEADEQFTCGDFRYVKDAYGNCTVTGYTGNGGEVKFPASLDGNRIIAIGEGAFRDQPEITSIIIPRSVISIGDEAFMGCTGLTRVVISNKVETIGEKALGYADAENKAEGFVIEGICGTAAETYAEENGIEFAEHHHRFMFGRIILRASCTKEGVFEKTCGDCGDRDLTPVAKVPHRFTVKVKTVAPTTESEGYTIYKCKNCSETKKLDIVPKLVSLNNAKILGIKSSYAYTGNKISPVPSVDVNGVRPTRSTDYKCSYTNNLNAGTATITITGIGKYTGKASKTFRITPANISGARTSGLKATYKYTGKERKPKPIVTFNGRTLTLDQDYTLSWANNKEIGTATITITGKGNFSGTKTVTFKVVRQGWFEKDGRTYYYTVEGEPLKNTLQTIDGSEYYFDGNGWMATSWQSINGQFMFFGRLDGKRVLGKTVDGIPISGSGSVDTSGYNGTKINTMMTAHSFVESICNPTDSMETKRLKCFKWLFQFPYHRFRLLSDKYWLPGWENDFAMDIFVRKAGCCVSEAAACAFMFHEIGYEDVYIAHDTAHAWVYMNGRVYDPLFAEAKDFNSNYDVVIPVGVYRNTAVDMRKI